MKTCASSIVPRIPGLPFRSGRFVLRARIGTVTPGKSLNTAMLRRYDEDRAPRAS